MKKSLLRIVSASLIASLLMLPAAGPALAAPAKVYQEWDKAQEHVELYQLWFTDRADNGLIPIRQNQKWGFINYDGKMILKPQFQIARDPFTQGVAVVNNNQLINTSGKVIFQDKGIKYIGGFNYDVAIAEKKGKIGYLNTKGVFVIPPTYEDGTSFYNQVAFVKKNGKWALIDTKGKPLTPFNIEEQDLGPQYMKSGLYPVKINGLWGCIDNKGKLIIPAEFESAVKFTNQNIELGFYKDNVSAIVKQDGSIITLDTYYYRALSEPLAGLLKIQGVGQGIIDISGQVVVEPKDEQEINLSRDGSFAVKGTEDGQIGWRFFNKDKTPQFDGVFADAKVFSEGLAAVKLDQKWGYISKKGEIKLPYQYDDAHNFLSGSAVIRKGNKYGLIGQKGETIAPAKYDEITPLVIKDNFINNSTEKITTTNPLYRIKLNQKYGIIDSRGTIIMDIKHQDLYVDYVEYFHDIGPIATVWYTANSKGELYSTSINIQSGKRMFPEYRGVYYLGNGIYSGFPLKSPSKYAIFNAKGKAVFLSAIEG